MATESLLWLPTAADVAAVLRARTKDSNGDELGAWTADTRPTDVEVDALIAQAAEFIAGQVGAIGTTCDGAAHSATVYHAACLVELSYFPEQVRSDRSPYEMLKELADEALEGLRGCTGAGGAEGGGRGGEGFGYHSLPITPETTWRYYGDAGVGGYGWRHPERAATWQRPLVPPSSSEPALIDEPEPPPEPPIDVVIGHPPQHPEAGLPPLSSDGP